MGDILIINKNVYVMRNIKLYKICDEKYVKSGEQGIQTQRNFQQPIKEVVKRGLRNVNKITTKNQKGN